MYDFEELDFYELLGVSRSASPEEIKRAYRREIAKYHPDRFVQAPPAEMEYARRRSQMLTEAYATLSDFGARSAYNLDRRARERRLASTPRPQPPQPPQPRDHQAELYEQARSHFDAGRFLQAAAVLRQLHQINPFYRDSAELLATTEERLRVRAPGGEPAATPRRLSFMFAGAFAIILITGSAIWWLMSRDATPDAAQAGIPASATTVTTVVSTLASMPTAVPPTATPIPPTATPIPPTATPIPPSPTATSRGATATPVPTPTTVSLTPTALPTLEGALLLRDETFDGWADARRETWSVGPSEERYRISANTGVGVIWSYRSFSASDVAILVDIEVIDGEGGLMMRFRDDQNYLLFTVTPRTGVFRLEQVRDGVPTLITDGIRVDIRNEDGRGRLEARLRGGRVTVSMDGLMLADAELDGLSNAPRFGLVVAARETRAETFFDNLEIRALP